MFVDYGNKITVHRRDILAPVNTLKLFTQQPFGIECFVSDVKGHTMDEWSKRLIDNTVHIMLGPAVDGVFPATFVDGFLTLNNGCDNIKRPTSGLSPEAPEWLPTSNLNFRVYCMQNCICNFDFIANGNNPMTSDASRKLMFDAPEVSSSRTVSPPNVVSDPAPAATRNMSNGLQAHSNGATTKSAASATAEPMRSRATSFSSMTSSVNQEPTNWDKISPKRNMPIAHSISYFYPVQPDLGGATKSVEVVFTESPNSFYCQLAEAIPILDELMEKLANSYKGNFFFLCVENNWQLSDSALLFCF